MRGILIVLVLASPALAGPPSWRTVLHGDATTPATPRRGAGNADTMEVLADGLVTFAEAMAHTTPFTADQSDKARDQSVSWYGLLYVGSEEATDHKWEIVSRVAGTGGAHATADLDGGSWAESLQIIEFSGDHDNRGLGQLAVSDAGGATVSLRVPLGFGVGLGKTHRSQEDDGFVVCYPKKTAGKGKACRVRVDAWAEAAVSTTCTIGLAHASLYALLHADLEMTGSCLYRGTRVEDTFRMAGVPEVNREVTPPSGGVAAGPAGEIPTDEPTEEEREGTEEDLPVRDAKGLPGNEDGPTGDNREEGAGEDPAR